MRSIMPLSASNLASRLANFKATANRYRQLGPLLKMLDQIEGTEPVVGFAYGRM